MTDVDRLLQTYIERFEAGDADSSELLEQAEGADRARLSALIEGYLEHAAPSREWDAAAFQGSVAGRAVQMLQDSWEEETSTLPAQLVALRKQAELKRSDLVASLAAALDAASAGQREKVAGYYNAMEHGRLDPSGVSARVFDALAELLGTTAESLRKAGESVAASAGADPGQAFARTKLADSAGLAAADSSTASQPDPDEIDRLFTGG